MAHKKVTHPSAKTNTAGIRGNFALLLLTIDVLTDALNREKKRTCAMKLAGKKPAVEVVDAAEFKEIKDRIENVYCRLKMAVTAMEVIDHADLDANTLLEFVGPRLIVRDATDELQKATFDLDDLDEFPLRDQE